MPAEALDATVAAHSKGRERAAGPKMEPSRTPRSLNRGLGLYPSSTRFFSSRGALANCTSLRPSLG